MARVLLIVCVSWTVAHLSDAQRTPSARIQRRIASARLLATIFVSSASQEVGLDIPGVADYQTRYWKTNGIKVIAGTSDVGHRDFNEAARTYASRYNAALLKYLATHRSSNAKT
jgi:hypothetical protein